MTIIWVLYVLSGATSINTGLIYAGENGQRECMAAANKFAVDATAVYRDLKLTLATTPQYFCAPKVKLPKKTGE